MLALGRSPAAGSSGTLQRVGGGVASDVWTLVDELREDLAERLGDELVGLYVFGSLVLGDFDDVRSDIDLLTAVRSPVDDRHVGWVAGAVDRFVARHPEWVDRVELLCAPLAVLRAHLAGAGQVVRVSPGEPTHRVPASPHWLTDLYVVQERGVVLLGPVVADVLPRIGREEFRRCVRDNVVEWRTWAQESAAEGFLAYAVLTLCRALYACATGEQASKPAAGRWVAQRYPQWAPLVASALDWRAAGADRVDSAAQAEVIRFVEFAVAETRSAGAVDM
jgi:hypothetical protein